MRSPFDEEAACFCFRQAVARGYSSQEGAQKWERCDESNEMRKDLLFGL